MKKNYDALKVTASNDSGELTQVKKENSSCKAAQVTASNKSAGEVTKSNSCEAKLKTTNGDLANVNKENTALKEAATEDSNKLTLANKKFTSCKEDMIGVSLIFILFVFVCACCIYKSWKKAKAAPDSDDDFHKQPEEPEELAKMEDVKSDIEEKKVHEESVDIGKSAIGILKEINTSLMQILVVLFQVDNFSENPVWTKMVIWVNQLRMITKMQEISGTVNV